MIAFLLLAAFFPAKVSIRSDVVLRKFVPERFFGAGLDGSDQGSVSRTFRDRNVKAMKSVGIRSLTYRLRTELAGDAWHWNPKGTWSDAAHGQGYWTGDSKPGASIKVSWGYRLPRRGNTFDQANNDGYSRITDGNPESYWKSNPYLDSALSGEGQAPPQWIVLDLKRHVSVNGIRIRWAKPYAVRFRVEYWRGAENFEQDDSLEGGWFAFRKGDISQGRGGDESIDLGPTESVRFVRLILLQSSHSSTPGEDDPRNRMGFAVREIEMGRLNRGVLHDEIKHRPKHDQTPVYTSSTDPWHRSIDRDPGTEQPGFDLVFKSGLSYGLPTLVPVPVLYDTPENAEAEIRWLQARGYRLRGVELGEEPDGQYCDPEHYTDLYLQVARRIRKVAPTLALGGPCFQSATYGDSAWPDRRPKSWMRRFMEDLRRRGGLGLFDFFSFEWYPFDQPFGDSSANIRQNAALLRGALAQFRKDGLPAGTSWSITEYGYSAFAGPHDVGLESGLLNLDTVGQCLTLGGSGAYLYGYEPGSLISDTGQWGNLMTWLVDGNGDARYPLPAYWAARMMTTDWCASAGGSHDLVKETTDDPSIAVYAVKRPDHLLSVLLLNKDSARTRKVVLTVDGHHIKTGREIQFGKEQYAWRAAGEAGRPLRSLPPKIGTLKDTIALPPYSITVVQTSLQADDPKF